MPSKNCETEELGDKVSPIKSIRETPDLMNTTLNATGATGLGTTFHSSHRDSKDQLNSSSLLCFNPSISASALRHSSHKYTFPKSKRNVFGSDSITSLKPSRDSSDALYELPSTLSKEATLFGKDAKDRKP